MPGTNVRKVGTGLAVVLVVGLAIVFAIHHAHRYKGPSHFPRAAWAAAGYGDPVSALETACWAVRQGDGKAMLASITPELQRELHAAWEKRGKGRGISEEDFFAAAARKPFSHVIGFRVLGEQAARGERVLLYLYIQGWWRKETVIMEKTGGEWRVAGIRRG